MGLAAFCLAAALIKGLGFGGYPGLECVAYVPAAAVIFLAAMLRMQVDLLTLGGYLGLPVVNGMTRMDT